MDQKYRIPISPQCHPEAAVRGGRYRITVLTPRLFRLEYCESGQVEDRATQCALHRDFPVPEFRTYEKNGWLSVETESLRLTYDKRPFSRSGLSIRLQSGRIWRFGDRPADLGGTARTLDEADGAVPLGPGLVSREGFALLDDSGSMLLREDGWVDSRESGVTDLYFFGYGHDYAGCLRDFYRLSGRVPLLPRWALGNWWSRYYAYSADSYKALMERFEREQIPFSVSVLDMDWHLVEDVDPKYGSGWTGYTWNPKLFPDPPAFLKWLHDRGMKVTLNVHPADGVRAFEAPYPAIAREMGADASRGEPVDFDAADPHFMEAYFECVHHPLEDQGVDFWWIDWQQGSVCRIPHLDPLWILNHFHYLDSRRRGRRPVIFSRYAGPGSHRYPIGFSGDTVVSWASLAFQPYFTATASNIGYGWWSHDIGGHMHGVRDDELATRWVQLGVFSPIMRLHSTSNRFNSKEPWRFDAVAGGIMKEFLRLRHRLVPYLYTMNRLASREGQPLVRPMYWLAPERPEAYRVPNEYAFGTELIAAPITQKRDPTTRLAQTRAWLPEGDWFDVFSGRRYPGGRMRAFWRPLESLPVLARAGGIVPLAAPGRSLHSTANPETLEVHVFPGADGRFTLWEDAGDTPDDRDENWARTELTLAWGAHAVFCIGPAQGNRAGLPERRRWVLKFCGVADAGIRVLADGSPVEARTAYDGERHRLTAVLPPLPVTAEIRTELNGAALASADLAADTFRLLDRAQMPFDRKEIVQRAVEAYGAGAVPELEAMGLERPLLSALMEILLP